MELLLILLDIVLILLLSDFITGMIHWWEDSYGDPKWKFFGPLIVEPNLQHHKDPKAFLNKQWIERVNTSVALAIITLFFLWIFEAISWQTIFLCLVTSQANQVHAFAHRTRQENGWFITSLQSIGIIQSIRQHHKHHTAPYDCNYCIMTNWLNPFLNYIRFWWLMEKFILIVFKIDVIKNSDKRDFV